MIDVCAGNIILKEKLHEIIRVPTHAPLKESICDSVGGGLIRILSRPKKLFHNIYGRSRNRFMMRSSFSRFAEPSNFQKLRAMVYDLGMGRKLGACRV